MTLCCAGLSGLNILAYFARFELIPQKYLLLGHRAVRQTAALLDEVKRDAFASVWVAPLTCGGVRFSVSLFF
jgi:hypothetical protein